MAYYGVVMHSINDFERYVSEYVPGTIELIGKHGGEVLAAPPDADRIEGDPPRGFVILKFPSKESFDAWHADPDYAPLIDLRHSLTSDCVFLGGEELVLPS